VTSPAVVILDEPSSGLDMAGRELLSAALDAIADPALSIILITHYLEEIPTSFDHVLLLREGQSLASGPIHDTLTSVNVSATLGINVDVGTHSRRWWARAT
jgi:iron complex transport system ATP-binding protein